MVDALSFRQGTVVTWNQSTGENTVNVGGSILANLPVLTTSEVTSLEAGDVVGLLRSGTQYFVLGRIDLAGSAGGNLNIGAGSAGRGLLDYAFATSALPSGGVTVNVHTSSTLQVTVNPEANRLLRISLYTSAISTIAGDRIAMAIRDITLREIPTGYTGPLTVPTSSFFDPDQGYVYIQERGATVQAGPRAQVAPIVAYDDRGLSGSRTYQATLRRVSGTGTCRIDSDAEGPSTLLVEDVGPLL
jgi:hypothetical protein